MSGTIRRYGAMMAALAVAASVGGCGGGGERDKPSYTVGGAVTGLNGSGLVLQNTGGGELSISGNGSFSFSRGFKEGEAFNVTVKTQPANPRQACTVTGGSGIVGSANITTMAVTCADVYAVGGAVSGLVGSGLVLQNNGGDALQVSGNGKFTFAGYCHRTLPMQ